MFPLLLRTLEERRTSLAVALGHAGCARGPTEPARVGVGDLSVVLVILDAAGAPYLGAYGNPFATSPNVDALARNGAVLFERAYAQSAWTLPSAASLLTGPPRRRQTQTLIEGETLAVLLNDAGFWTAAFSENPYVTAHFGFACGFDVFREYFPESALLEDPRFYRVDTARTTTDAVAWLEADQQGRAFLVSAPPPAALALPAPGTV